MNTSWFYIEKLMISNNVYSESFLRTLNRLVGYLDIIILYIF